MKDLRILLFVACFVGTSMMTFAQIPTLDWVKTTGSTANDRISDIVKDGSGNLYVSGIFTGTVDFDSGPSVFTQTSAGSFDGFVMKLDAEGNFVWAFRLGGSQTDNASQLTVDASGNVYVVGTFANTVDFDPGSGTTAFTATASGSDMYLLKLTNSGSFLWAKRFAGTNNETPVEIAVNNSNELVLVGNFQSTVDFDPDAGVQNLVALPTLADIFLLRLTTDGTFLSVGHITGLDGQYISGMTFDPSGNILITGNFQSTGDFDPGPGTSTKTAGADMDVYVVKLTPTFGLTWVIQYGGPGSEYGIDIKTDASGNIFVAGWFSNTVDFDPNAGVTSRTAAGGVDGYFCKFTPLGELDWVRTFGGTDGDYVHTMVLDNANNIYIAGQILGTTDLDPGAGVVSYTSAGAQDLYYSKFDSNGSLIYASATGSAGSDHIAVSLLSSTNVMYHGAVFQSVVDFDPGSGVANATSAGGQDFALFRISETASPGPQITSFTPATGMVGAAVTISGSNFSGDPASNLVQFNGTTAIVSVSSLTSITVTVPAGATTGPITVTVGGLTATSATNFTVVATPTIAITTQPADLALCPDGSGSLTVAATGAANLTYRWQRFNTGSGTFVDLSNGSGYSGVTSTSLTIDIESGATFGDYRVRINGDLAAQVFSEAVTVSQITPPPPPTGGAVVVDGSCGPASATLVASSPSAIEFRWFTQENTNFPFFSSTDGTFATPELTGGTIYLVAAFDGFCESDQTAILVTASYDGPGALDNTFNPPPNSQGSISFIDNAVLQSTNKIVVNSYETGLVEYSLFRFNVDGSLDASFNPMLESRFTGRVDHIAVQSDDKIILGGRFSQIDGDNFGRIARANADGTLDVSFNTSGSGFNARVNDILVLPDDKMIVSGAFTTYNGTPAPYLVRLNANGSLDATFNTGSGANAQVRDMTLLSDGDILISGFFSSYNGMARAYLARLNADGTLDNSFAPPGDEIYPITMLEQTDGRLLIGGEFETVGGLPRKNLARLNTDGSVDPSFDPGEGFDDAIYSLYEDGSGKIVVGGWFETVDNVPQNFLTRLNPDGSRDEFFEVGIGPYTLVTEIIPYGTDRLLIAGYIDSWNLNAQNALALVKNECIRIPSASDESTCNGSVTLTACGGKDGQYRWYTVPTGGSEIAGETASTLSLTNISATSTFYVTLKDDVCESVRVPVVVNVTGGVTPPATSNSSGCLGATQDLSATGGSDGQYRWYTTSTGGTAIAGEVNSNFTTPALTSTTTYYVALNNGTCESTRTAVTAAITTVDSPTVANGFTCGSGSVVLTAANAPSGEFRWYNTSTGGTPYPGENNATFTTPSISTTTSFFVARNNGTCESDRVEVVAEIRAVPTQPSASPVTVCTNEPATLIASGASNGQYRWYRSDLSLIAGEVNSEYVTPALSSNQTYFVSALINACESVRTSVAVTVNTCIVNSAPVINTTSAITQIGGSTSIDLTVLINDVDGNVDLGTLSVVTPPSSGAAASIVNGTLTLDYSQVSFSGMDQLTIRVCDLLATCTEAVITIEVIGDIIVYNAISPNGDGVNDFFRIEYIDVLEDTRGNVVTIHNRWGDKIFSTRNYDNVSNYFSGRNQNGNVVPTGTYFYTIRFDSGRKEETGYLYVKD